MPQRDARRPARAVRTDSAITEFTRPVRYLRDVQLNIAELWGAIGTDLAPAPPLRLVIPAPPASAEAIEAGGADDAGEVTMTFITADLAARLATEALGEDPPDNVIALGPVASDVARSA